MNIANPSSAQIPDLRRLWEKAFGDEDSFLDCFFSTAFSPDRSRCVLENGRILAALYWFDVSCRDQKFAYLYAVATDPEYRGRGLCRSLMEDVRTLLSGRGYHGLILVPQKESLRAMYRKMGYSDCGGVSTFLAPAEPVSLPLRRLNTDEYAALRRQLLPESGILQEGVNLEFLCTYALLFGGDDWIAAVSVEGDTLFCPELLGNPDAAYGLVGALGCKEGNFRIPGTDQPFAQYLKLREDCVIPGYFGLAFD